MNHPTMVLICIFLVANDVEHLFMCLFVFCIFSCEMSLHVVFPFFKINLFILFYFILFLAVQGLSLVVASGS